MSRRRKTGTNTLIQRLLNGAITDTHHLDSKGQGGSNKKSNKKEVPKFKHKLWHFLVGDSSPEKAAEILSYWIKNNSRFFAVTKGESIHKIVQEINQWLNDDDIKIKVVFKRSKIIQFRRQKDSLYHLPKIVS